MVIAKKVYLYMQLILYENTHTRMTGKTTALVVVYLMDHLVLF